jgi:hypothetical protein
MAGGCIDILIGSRGTYEKCVYWNRDNDNEDLEEYTHKKEPSGFFYANLVEAKDNEKQIINNNFMFDNDNVTLFTKQKIKLKSGDIVKYDNELWLVRNVQEKKIHRNTQLMKNPNYVVYIQLKR